jgi:hypothetical protein
MDFNKAIENRNFQGVFIPADLYLNTNLTWTEKILIIEINSLDKEIEGVRQGCFASNEYLAAFLDKEANSLANMITDLRSRGIVIERKKFDGRRRYIGIDFEAIKAEPKRIKAVKLKKEQKQQGSQKSEGFEDSQNNEGSLHKKVNPAFTKKCEQLSQKNEHINTNIKTDINTVDKKETAEKSASFETENIEDAIFDDEPLEDKPFAEKRKKVAPKKEKSQPSVWPANFPPALIPFAEKFLEYRKEIKKPYRSDASLKTKLNQFIEQAEKYGVQAVIESIETAVGQGWTGTFIDKKYLNTAKQKPTPQTIPASDQAQRDKLALLKTKCHNKRIDFSNVTGDIPAQIIQLEKLLA